MMPVSKLHHFFADLPAPMGFNTTGESTMQIVNRRTPAASFNEMREQVTKLAQRIKTFQDGGTAMVYFNDVAKECALHSFGSGADLDQVLDVNVSRHGLQLRLPVLLRDVIDKVRKGLHIQLLLPCQLFLHPLHDMSIG